jgi:hypothetical protein
MKTSLDHLDDERKRMELETIVRIIRTKLTPCKGQATFVNLTDVSQSFRMIITES